MIPWFIVPFIHGEYKDPGGDFRGECKDKRVVNRIHLASKDATLLFKFFNRSFEFHILMAYQAGLTAPNEARLHSFGQLASTAQSHHDLRQSIMDHTMLGIFSATYDYAIGAVQGLVYDVRGKSCRMNNQISTSRNLQTSRPHVHDNRALPLRIQAPEK